jgi:2-(1,2-epoxy-1,2-dihydrophenyl)acetyl-CoA isomerase
MSMTPMILSEKQGAVCILTLNNPSQYNALGGTMIADLCEALDHAVEDGAIRAVVITGAGKGFCSGAQLGDSGFNGGDGIGAMIRQSLNPLIEKMRNLSVPIVVAVNGPAAGAGVGVALAGDIVVASRSARFILSFVALGAALDAGTSLFLQRSIGAGRARALALLGEPLDAQTAADWGLVWKVVDDGLAVQEALAIAQRLAGGPPVALKLIKDELNSGWSASLSSALESEACAQGKAFSTEDLREGAAAFLQKRTARFIGR